MKYILISHNNYMNIYIGLIYLFQPMGTSGMDQKPEPQVLYRSEPRSLIGPHVIVNILKLSLQ